MADVGREDDVGDKRIVEEEDGSNVGSENRGNGETGNEKEEGRRELWERLRMSWWSVMGTAVNGKVVIHL